MRARVEERWPADVVDVWLYRDAGAGAVQVLELGPADQLPAWRLAAITDQPGAPTLTLPTAALEALAEAASGLRPPSREQAAALEDTRAVRDRLLTLVERSIP